MIQFDIFAKNDLRSSHGEIGLLLEGHIRHLLLAIVGGNPEFVREKILSDKQFTNQQGDVSLYNSLLADKNITPSNIDEKKPYDARMRMSVNALCSLFQVQPGIAIDVNAIRTVPIDLRWFADHLDLQGLNKVLDQTTYSRVCTRPNNPVFKSEGNLLRGLFGKLAKFRNHALGHDTQAAPPRETLQMLEELCDSFVDRAVRHAFKSFYIHGSATIPILDALCVDLSALTGDIHLYLDGYTIDQSKDGLLDRRHLYKYTVIADEWAFQSKYVSFITQDLLSCTQINVFQTTAKALWGIRKNKDDPDVTADERAACKTALLELEKHIEDQDGRVAVKNSFTEADGTPFDTWENILKLLEQKPDEKICVITDPRAEAHARQVMERGNPNHVVAYLNSAHTVKPASLQSRPAFSFTVLDEDGKELSLSENPSGRQETAAWGPDQSGDKITFQIGAALPEARENSDAQTEREAGTNSEAAPGAQGRRLPQREPAPEEEELAALLVLPKEGDTVSFDRSGNLRTKLGKQLGGGAEGAIYASEEFKSYAIKIFKESHLTEDRLNKLKKMLEFYRNAPDKVGAFRGICWPIFPVYCLGSLVGYAMERVPSGNNLDGLLAALQAQSEQEGFPELKRSDLLRICERMLDTFSRLHRLTVEGKPVLMGDINPKNVMVSFDGREGWQVWLVDVDSYQFGSEPCPVGRPEYFSIRIAQNLGNRKVSSLRELPREVGDEKAALATLLFYTLMIRQLPYKAHEGQDYLQSIRERSFLFADRNEPLTRHNYIWQNFSKELQDLFREAFGGGKGQAMRYPELSEWRDAIHRQRGDTVDNARYSNEINPTATLRGDKDRFLRIRCRLCGKEFEVSEQARQQDLEQEINLETDLCPSCKTVRSVSQAKILSCVCRKCGRSFTVSEWDYMDNPYCPDCDPSFTFSRKGEFSDPVTFTEKLRKKIAEAVNNYLESEE